MMYLVNDSFSIVLIGDWSKFYIQPEWIGKNVYKQAELDLSVEGSGIDYSISYRCKNVVIVPAQEKIVFTATNTEIETLGFFANCVNNFIEHASTPNFIAYGLNLDYVDSDTSVLADVFDDLSDNSLLIGLGYEITTSKLSRKLKKGEQIINMDCKFNGAQTTIYFNEHHTVNNQKITISVEDLINYLALTQNILVELGYDMGDEEN